MDLQEASLKHKVLTLCIFKWLGFFVAVLCTGDQEAPYYGDKSKPKELGYYYTRNKWIVCLLPFPIPHAAIAI